MKVLHPWSFVVSITEGSKRPNKLRVAPAGPSFHVNLITVAGYAGQLLWDSQSTLILYKSHHIGKLRPTGIASQ